MSLCKYKNIFGQENTGIHKYRFLGLAILDVIGTILIACIIGYIFNFNIILCIAIAFILGIILHRMFCVNTTINKLIFGTISTSNP